MKIFIVDDEPEIRKSLREILEDENFEVETFSTGKTLLKQLKNERPSLILLDVWLGKEDGIVVLDECKKLYPTLPVLMISGHGTIEIAVSATKKGAVDFLEKPLSIEKVLQAIENVIKPEEKYSSIKLEYDEILGNSPAIQKVKFAIAQAASTNARVFIYGENGTGKELVARTIFKNSKRKDLPFVEMNCAAIPEELIESELFGFAKGAFTGATDSRIGKFEAANGGTLFLDEICDMSLSTQAKVLRILQEQRFEKLGSTETITVDVRIIAATNIPVEEAIREGKFREDLYYRLNVIPITIPPLRERTSDIPLLVDYYISKTLEENNLPPKKIESEAISILQNHFWPGNIRELKNVMERLCIMTVSPTIAANDARDALKGFKTANEMVELGDFRKAKEEFERQYIIKTLQTNEGNVTRTSRVLGIERSHLYRKMKSLNISSDQYTDG
ncbi:sigma-54-dependent transcriptional regulator [Leptospira borgpetersenii]|uniref:Response regulator of a two component response regulator n=2 Tax=Leptospira borgpetersenii serovar Hardjo-bovis TaxID=338217 RepID=Q04SV5_LEPBJ|nr:sigma-54 dependent transcriptional regulator [Leptospira borgpetersenii]ABJ76015.1 Response regulator of a two component response regulator [Leptospira borgpetersenii serovar Hardjo-bovis str. JB197]ABJ79116.1 Response regulator of a two component response regulator [Leptospira borgpetersenii serovar Hardjo-bovis str. L550]AMX58420.1 Fis family transcriptional regulator [Leptospira borgpetersenii serovar Hardjo]AMX61673.1 Fis family transcriptional regulator [Leptospira borgpetersenii serova